jgi:hypothetical protein
MKIEVVNKLKNLPIKTSETIQFPTYKISSTNNFYYSTIYGVRGAGKTNCLINILEIEREIMLTGENKVYWFSPTCDDKVSEMIKKYPDNFVYIDELNRARLDEVLEVIKIMVEDWYEKMEAYKLLKKLVGAKFNLKVLEPEELRKLEENNFFIDTDWQNFNTEHPPISQIVFDDMAGNPLLNGSGKDSKYFYSFALKHRHKPHHCGIFILSQYPKAISRPIRSQANLIIQFASMNYENLKMMFSEYSALFEHKMSNYIELLKLIEQRKDRSFLLMFYDSRKFVRINFNEEVKFD